MAPRLCLALLLTIIVAIAAVPVPTTTTSGAVTAEGASVSPKLEEEVDAVCNAVFVLVKRALSDFFLGIAAVIDSWSAPVESAARTVAGEVGVLRSAHELSRSLAGLAARLQSN